jgi:hypothetical protein
LLAADLQEKPTKPVEAELSYRHSCFVGFDEDGGCHANIAASGAGNGAQRACEEAIKPGRLSAAVVDPVGAHVVAFIK